MEIDFYIKEAIQPDKKAGEIIDMLYSVVVTYNGSKWIDKCISSLIHSSLLNNVIVIDNGSTDGTLELIYQKYPQVEVIRTKENLGFGKANNLGLKKAYDAGAEYVFLLNQDAWVAGDTLEKLVEVASRYPEYGIVSPIHLNGTGEKLDINFSNYIAPQNCPNLYSDMWTSRLENKIYKVNFVNAAAWLINRKTIETVGGFNPIFFLYSEDDNYIHRLRYHGLEIGVFPYANIYHDREDTSLSKYITDSLEVELRGLIIKYTNPGEEATIRNSIKKLYKEIIKNALLFRIFHVQYFIKLLNKLKEIAPEIQKTKHVSKEPGLSFL